MFLGRSLHRYQSSALPSDDQNCLSSEIPYKCLGVPLGSYTRLLYHTPPEPQVPVIVTDWRSVTDCQSFSYFGSSSPAPRSRMLMTMLIARTSTSRRIIAHSPAPTRTNIVLPQLSRDELLCCHLLRSSQSGTSSSTDQRKTKTPVGPRFLKRLLNSSRRPA